MTSTSQDESRTPEHDAEEPKRGPKLSNFAMRYLTAIALLPIAISGMYIGGLLWTVLVTPFVIIGTLEFYALAREKPFAGIALAGLPAVIIIAVAFHFDSPGTALFALPVCAVVALLIAFIRDGDAPRLALTRAGLTLLGLLYVAFPLASVIALRHLPDGFLWLVILFAGTWGADTFAYFGGRVWGRRKLAPRLSPNKTVEGAVVGVIGGFSLALLFLYAGGQARAETLVLLVALPIIAMLGDLLESAIKRYFDVKDSHVPGLNVIPGHGGVLDRVDALLLTAAFTYVYLAVLGIAG